MLDKKILDKQLHCYICSKKIDKKKKNYSDVDIKVIPSLDDAGIVIKTQIHTACILDFYKRFFDICGKGEEKCASEKKPKKSSTAMKRK